MILWANYQEWAQVNDFSGFLQIQLFICSSFSGWLELPSLEWTHLFWVIILLCSLSCSSVGTWAYLLACWAGF